MEFKFVYKICSKSEWLSAIQNGKFIGTKKDISKAMEWYLIAAERNESQAQFNLAVIYHQGSGNNNHIESKIFFLEEISKILFDLSICK